MSDSLFLSYSPSLVVRDTNTEVERSKERIMLAKPFNSSSFPRKIILITGPPASLLCTMSFSGSVD